MDVYHRIKLIWNNAENKKFTEESLKIFILKNSILD